MSQDQTAVFMDHIREHAPQYFDDFDSTQVEVRLKERQERSTSILYQFSVGDKAQNYGILVKVPLDREQLTSDANGLPLHKPNLYPKTEVKDTHKLGYSALKAISEYFSNLGEEQLGTVRVLDYLPEYQAIITEESSDPNLRQLFMNTSRFRSRIPARDLDLPFRNVGRWLRLYHEMSKEDNVEIRHAHRHEYIEAITKLSCYLAEALDDSAFFQKVALLLEKSALGILPHSLPLGLGHGDFAMRNILVGPAARITVIDTFAKWRAPIYEDIGYFLNALNLSAPQVISQGLVFGSAQLKTYEHAFLEGYFGQKPIPYAEIRLYEMMSLLDKWSSVVAHYHRRGNKFKKFSTMKAILANRYFKKSAKSLLEEITTSRSL